MPHTQTIPTIKSKIAWQSATDTSGSDVSQHFLLPVWCSPHEALSMFSLQHPGSLRFLSQELLSQSPWATITKYHRLDGLNSRPLFLMFLEAESSHSGCWLIQFLVKAFCLLVEGTYPSLLMVFPCACKQGKQSLSSSTCKATNTILKAPPTWLFITKWPPEGSVFKYHHFGG